MNNKNVLITIAVAIAIVKNWVPVYRVQQLAGIYGICHFVFGRNYRRRLLLDREQPR